ncbi:Glycosyltransferase involved in cell wall bisynthesis [Loktanella sp. DSM 29012]|uniref:glycosyltransferase n=1 Tax=Loktanella sp. DSM 29012 TaxID=1881056 RepID=UPI0008D74525|nr:glycosyltransferase [Loktanella sp. DSM 29012]SEQ78569.1 Glycosyltransferase involved in cell wall bisynthesis [Loktanella sp. DSM 29012]
MTLRVLHVSPYMAAAAGGPPVVVDRLVARAAANGADAHILTTTAYSDDSGAGLRRTYPDLTLLPHQRAALTGAGRAAVRRAVAQADILHLHTVWSPLTAVAAAAARRQGVPYVLSPHGMLDPYSLAQKRLKKRAYLALVEGRVLRGAARLIYTAQDERDLAAPVVGHDRADIVALGADAPPGDTAGLRAAFFARHPDLAGRSLALFLGRLDDKKRPETALQALNLVRSDHPDAGLLMVGTGPAEQALRNLTRQLGLQDAVRFTGFLSGQDKWQAMAACDLFVLPSRQENFAIALAEALHAGLPALLTRRVNIWREITGAGAGVVIDDTDEAAIPTHLAAGWRHWLVDPAARIRAASAAGQLARAAFDWDDSAARTHAIYRAVLAG